MTFLRRASSWFGGVFPIGVVIVVIGACGSGTPTPIGGVGGAGGVGTGGVGTGGVGTGGVGGAGGVGGTPGTGGVGGKGGAGGAGGKGGAGGAGGGQGGGGSNGCPTDKPLIVYAAPGCGTEAVPICYDGRGGACGGTVCGCDGQYRNVGCTLSDVPFAYWSSALPPHTGACDPRATGGEGGIGGAGGAGGGGGKPAAGGAGGEGGRPAVGGSCGGGGTLAVGGSCGH